MSELQKEFERMKGQLEDIHCLILEMGLFRPYSIYKEFYNNVKEIMEKEK